MNSTAWQWVRDFCIKNDQARPLVFTPLNTGTRALRERLILEELGELSIAIHEKNLKNIVDGCCDLAYVLHGTGVAFGIQTESFFDIGPRNSQLVFTFQTDPESLNFLLDRLDAIAITCALAVSSFRRDRETFIAAALDAALRDVVNLVSWLNIPFDKCFAEVHRSNMSKTARPAGADGNKYGSGNPKGEGYTPPDLEQFFPVNPQSSLFEIQEVKSAAAQ